MAPDCLDADLQNSNHVKLLLFIINIFIINYVQVESEVRIFAS